MNNWVVNNAGYFILPAGTKGVDLQSQARNSSAHTEMPPSDAAPQPLRSARKPHIRSVQTRGKLLPVPSNIYIFWSCRTTFYYNTHYACQSQKFLHGHQKGQITVHSSSSRQRFIIKKISWRAPSLFETPSKHY